MNKKLYRIEFIQLLGTLGVGWVLASCTDAKPSNEASKTLAQKADDAAELLDSGNAVFIKKGEEQYDTLRKGFNKRIERFPAVIAVCKNTKGVAEAIAYARSNKLKVAVKSGGHSMEGLSGNDGGLVINLSLMNKVEWLDATTVKVQPACTLSQLYYVILPKSRIIPAGSCGTVGIGGLTLGGGYGFFSRTYGLTCDSLKEVTMVDGYGKIHSSKNDDELLWACRGGANGNFGVVTEMIFETKTAPSNFTSHRFKALKVDTVRAKNILEKWFELTARLPKSCFSAFVLNGKTLLILVTNFEEHSSEVQEVLDSFAALADKTTIGKPRALASALKVYYGIQLSIYFKNACAGMYQNFESISDCAEEVIEKVVSTPGMIYQVNTLGGEVTNEGFENASCFAHRSFPYVSELQSYWDNPAQEEKLVRTFDSIQEIFKQHGISAHYCNYPDLNFESPQLTYYGKNYPRLQQLKMKLDGDDIIGHSQSIRLIES
jgi:hypothetical protein